MISLEVRGPMGEHSLYRHQAGPAQDTRFNYDLLSDRTKFEKKNILSTIIRLITLYNFIT